ncbi:hypothetical protein DOT_4025 [Desulfosporosinus sp. OT]|nr:hypothetical protein DOT_4025 [Desulfosporosinus sp. OT]
MVTSDLLFMTKLETIAISGYNTMQKMAYIRRAGSKFGNPVFF